MKLTIQPIFATGLILIFSMLSATSQAKDFDNNPKTQAFIDEMVAKHQLDREPLETLFGQAKKRDDILEAISRPAEKSKPWHEYRKIFLTKKRISGGVEFWKENAARLKKAEKELGVEAAIIVAIIGVETRYGGNTGRYRVIDALSTLAFAYPPRAKFFRSELEHFLLLAREENVDLNTAKGSYAGAMGYGQFIPSSYRHYAIDFDQDGKRDLWSSLDDIIGSVANYFHEHHWTLGQPVARRTMANTGIAEKHVSENLKVHKTAAAFSKQGIDASPAYPANQKIALLELQQAHGAEYWLTTNNFYVITRYNRSPLYAMAVFQLSEEIQAQYLRSEQ